VAKDRNLALVHGRDAGNYLGKRTFTAAITANDGVDLSEVGAKRHAVQRFGYAERLVGILYVKFAFDRGYLLKRPFA
jgi:hypothetical protein